MKITNLVLLSSVIVLINWGYALNRAEKEYQIIDTTRFILKSNEDNFELVDKLVNKSVHIFRKLLVNPINQEKEKEFLVSTFNYSEIVNSFDIGNGFIGIHVSSFTITSEGSSQSAVGRDVFLIYDPIKSNILNGKLDFSITKERVRFMGCMSAKTVHFIISDINHDGFIDVGCIKEALQCTEYFDSDKDIDIISGPVFIQDVVEWYIFRDSRWFKDISYSNILGNYIDLPLIDIKLTPVDFFGFMKWYTYDPKNWLTKGEVKFYPQYRKKLISREKHTSFSE